MNFEPVIGIEIHVEMKTKTKMFSSAPNAFGKDPNTLVQPTDIAFPGTMPVVNKQAVINAIRVSSALHMRIDNELHFDRKNYFYSDLPKGFQITQNERPIGSEGYVEIEIDGTKKTIAVERLHMEEDTCKQLHLADCTLVDYNRAGTPLIEIVSKPDIRSGEEAMKYVEAIRNIVIYSDVSDGKMEEGSLRCDVNISLRPYGSEIYGTKVEIKNLNSTANVKLAIDYEVKRQTELLLSGNLVEQETRRFDESKKETVLMRKKTDAVDYKYFPEPNIVPIRLSQEFIDEAIETCNELADSKIKRYVQLNLAKQDAEQMIQNRSLCLYFDKLVELKPELIKQSWNWLMGDVSGYLNRNMMTIDEMKLSPMNLLKLLELIESKEISIAQAKKVFERIVSTDEEPLKVAEEMGLKQNSNTDEIQALVSAVIDENPQSVIDFKNGKDRAMGFLIGQVMKKSQGKANPQIASKLVSEELKRR